jgi:hypothetical protein
MFEGNVVIFKFRALNGNTLENVTRHPERFGGFFGLFPLVKE